MILELKDKPYFIKLLSVFSTKKYLTFDISKNRLNVYSMDTLLSVKTDLFSFSGEKLIFTSQQLNLSILDTNKLIIKDTIILTKKNYRIDFPLFTPIILDFNSIGNVTTKFLVKPSLLKHLLGGLVVYEVENSRLFVRKIGTTVVEEVEILTLDFIRMGELSFRCNNNWCLHFIGLETFVENVMFMFSEDLLCVQFLFKKYTESFLEIQVPRSLIDGAYC